MNTAKSKHFSREHVLTFSTFTEKTRTPNLKVTYLGICLIFSYFIFFSGCDDSLTEPVVKEGSRNYVWTIDTLGVSSDSFVRIWGTSPADVWAVSPYSYPPDNILHFNGSEWDAVGPYIDFLARSIWGFSRNDVWFGASNGELWHYNGADWQKAAEITKDGNWQIVFDNMWGNQAYIFAFGASPDKNGEANNPIVAKLDNDNWILLNTDGMVGIVHQLFMDNNQRIFVQNIKWGGGDSTQIFEYRNGKFKQLYSSLWSIGYTSDISLINGEIYFVLGDKVSIRSNNQFQTVFSIEHQNFYGHIWGRTEKDIFMEMIDGIAHYNGNSIEYMHNFSHPRTRVYDAIIFEDEVFFLVSEGQTNLNLLYHGKLK